MSIDVPRVSLRDCLLCLSVVAGSWLGLALLRIAEPGPNDRSLAIHGIYDEAGHLLTALMIALGLRALRLPVPVWSVLAGGVVLDVGHVMIQLDFSEPVMGSSRNGTHSLLAVAIIALVGFIDRRHANVWLGIALGALSHLWRDLGTGLVPLAWPISDELWGTSFRRYLAGLTGITLVMIGSGTLLAVHARTTRPVAHDRGR